MTEAQAAARIAALCAANSDPALTAPELIQCVEAARRADSAGLAPGAAGWVPTFDLWAGAALGWELKAAKVAGAFDFSAGGESYSRSQMLRHFQAMAKQCRAKQSVTISLVGRTGNSGADIAGSLDAAGGWDGLSGEYGTEEQRDRGAWE